MNYQEVRAHSPGPTAVTDRWLARLNALAKMVLVALIFFGIFLFFKQPLAEQNAMRDKLEDLQAQSDELREKRDALLRQLSWIESDVGYLEIMARDRFNMHKSGEYVIRFRD